MSLPRRQFVLTAGAAALPARSGLAWAQAYPARPVHILAAASMGYARGKLIEEAKTLPQDRKDWYD